MWVFWCAFAAHAFTVPSFEPGRVVYRQPSDLAFATRQVDAATAAHPVYVVVYESVIDGEIAPGRVSETEEALEETWAHWVLAPGAGPEAFDPVEGSLIVLALDDREVRVKAGSRWDAELGLHGDALLPLIDDGFMPRATAGDLDGGLAALKLAVDGAITRGLEAAAAEEQRAVDRARRARQLRTAAAVGVPATGGLGLFTVGGIAGVLRRRRARVAEEAFRSRCADRRARIDRAEGAIADLVIDVETRDRVVALKLRGPRTTAVVGEVTELLDTIRVGLHGLRRRLDAVERGVRAGPFAVAPWERASAELDAPFDHDTGELRNELFGDPTRVVRLDPVAFMAELEERWARARGLWQRALDAVAASLRTASHDLPTADLERVKQALETAGLPLGWVADHPLLVDASGTWAQLDAVRVADPVAYLDALDAAVAQDDAIEHRVADLLGGREAARAARADAETPATDALDTVVPTDGDPRALAAEADRALEGLERRLHQPGDPAVARAAADAAIAAATALKAARVAVDDAVRTGAARLEAASVDVAATRAELERLRARATELLARHDAATLADVWTELGEASEDVGQGEVAASGARAALEAREHVRAVRLAEQVVREVAEAREDLAQLVAALTALERAEQEATALWQELDRQRAGHVAVLAGLGSYGGDRLGPGDALWAALRSEWGGPADWRDRASRIRTIQHAWSQAVSAARVEYEAAEASRRLAEARRRREAEAARVVTRAFSSSRATGSSYSSGSRSSGSRSSGGSSFSSAGRSGGRSFSGGGRSAGRKF